MKFIIEAGEKNTRLNAYAAGTSGINEKEIAPMYALIVSAPIGIHQERRRKMRQINSINLRIGRTKARGMRWIQLFPNIFPEDTPVDYHHVDGYLFVVPLPEMIHQKTISGKGKYKKRHLEWANNWIEFYYGMNPSDFLKEMDGFNRDNTRNKNMDVLLNSIKRKTKKTKDLNQRR